MQNQDETFVEIPCQNAAEFLQVLTATNQHFVGVEDTRLFRGESDVSRPLMPTAFRPDGMKKLIELNYLETGGDFKECTDIANNKGMWFHERMAISMFYKYANEQSLPLPPLTQETHVELLQRSNNLTAHFGLQLEWPRKELFPVMALAQHYGFPTRLLDWSGDPLASAYFAACRGINYLDRSERKIGVWQTHASVLRPTIIPFVQKENATTRYIAVVDAPYAGNPNLSAQKGRFTLALEKSKPLEDTGDLRKSLDEIFRDICVECDTNGTSIMGLPADFQSSTAFIKYSLPVSESADLLNRLHQRGYKATRFFPGYSACIKTVDELLKVRERIDYPPRPSASPPKNGG